MSLKNNDLFEYKDDGFEAKNIDAAMTKTIDEAWGVHYVEYLKSKGLDAKNIYAVEDLESDENHDYYLLKQRLENDTVLKFEVWLNDDETYQSLAQEESK